MICSVSLCDYGEMTDDRLSTPWGRLEWAREKAGFGDKAAFAKVVGLNDVTYRAYESGQNGFSKHAAKFAKALGVSAEWLLEGGPLPAIRRIAAETLPFSPDLPPSRDASAGETVEIIQLDLSLPMGTGASVDDYIEEEPRVFDLAYIRGFTRTPPHRLRIARGVGDSMFPTLQSSDMVWIDSTQTILNQADRIWAVSIHGMAAIKRLRRLGNGKVLIVSDNVAVENYEVDEADIRIGGRVIRFARDV